MSDAQAVWLKGKVYVGGGRTLESALSAKLYFYTPSTDSWGEMDTPVHLFALVTYHSQLVLVGGVKRGSSSVTNELWTLTGLDQWRVVLPPMTVKRHGASCAEYKSSIIVAGGIDESWECFDIIEVYNGHVWAEAQCLPRPCRWMKSTVLDGRWYLMGGYGLGKEVYCTSLASLVASSQVHEKCLPSVWMRFTDVHREWSSPEVLGSRLIAIGGGGGYPPTSPILAFLPRTKLWVHVGSLPHGLYSCCVVVLPSGMLMVIGGRQSTASSTSCVYKATLNGI